MNALFHLIGNDVRLLYRSGYVATSVIIILFFAVGASRLSIPPAGAMAEFIAALVIFLSVLSPFLTVGVLLLSEKSEGVLMNMAISPVPRWQLLFARAAVISMFSIAEMFILFFAIFGSNVDIAFLLAGLLSISVISTFMGIFAVAPHTALYSYVLSMTVWVLFLSLPAFGTFAGLNAVWTFWHPMTPPHLLLTGAFGAEDGRSFLWGGIGSLAWMLIAYLVATRGLIRMQSEDGSE